MKVLEKLNPTITELFDEELNNNILYPVEFSFTIPSTEILVGNKLLHLQL